MSGGEVISYVPGEAAVWRKIVRRDGATMCLERAEGHEDDARRYESHPLFRRFPQMATTARSCAAKLRTAVLEVDAKPLDKLRGAPEGP